MNGNTQSSGATQSDPLVAAAVLRTTVRSGGVSTAVGSCSRARLTDPADTNAFPTAFFSTHMSRAVAEFHANSVQCGWALHSAQQAAASAVAIGSPMLCAS